MLRGFVAVLVVYLTVAQNEEPFSLPTLSGDAFFADPFANTEAIGAAWKLSTSAKGDGSKFDGVWAIEANSANPEDLGLVVKSKAKHHAISAKLPKSVDFSALHSEQKPFVVQYEVKYQDSMECGGSYLKLVAEAEEEFSSEAFNDKSTYSIMFGPDKCGLDSKLHFIINFKNPVNGEVEEKHAKASSSIKEIFSDGKSHLVTLVLDYDGSFEMLVDQSNVNSGNIMENMTPSINPPAEIDDPSDSKPEDWDDKQKIPDPMASKPEDWDEEAPKFIADEDAVMPEDWLENEPEVIPDPAAAQPEDWDTEEDGEWEAPTVENPKCASGNCGPWTRPQIPNPAFKGKWAPPMIENPNYSGVWAPRKIANPGFFEDKTPFASLMPITAVGLELWTMTKDIMFDNIILTDSRSTADDWAAASWNKKALKEQMAGSGEGALQDFLVYAKENPWVWVAVVAAIIFPFGLYLTCFRGNGEVDEVGEAKKTDKPTADDENMPPLEGDEDDEVVEDEAEDAEVVEDEVVEDEAEVEEEEEEEEEEEKPVKRRTRKAD